MRLDLDQAVRTPDPGNRARLLRNWQRQNDEDHALFRQARAATVVELRAAGATWAYIVSLFGVSERHLRDEMEEATR